MVWFKKRIKLLGYIVTPEGITSDPEKVDAIRHAAIPKTSKQVRSLLGMVDFYSNLIPNYGSIVEPLLHLTRKNVEYLWGKDQQITTKGYTHVRSRPGLSGFE